MKTCPACNAQNDDNTTYCDDCGAELTAVEAAGKTADETEQVIEETAGADAEAEETGAAPAEPAGAHLVVVSTGDKIPLVQPETILGREDPISNIFPDVDTTPFGGLEGGVSRKHAKITEQNGQYQIEDLNSTNYTLVNKQKLEPGKPYPLAAGDEIRLGRVALLFMAG